MWVCWRSIWASMPILALICLLQTLMVLLKLHQPWSYRSDKYLGETCPAIQCLVQWTNLSPEEATWEDTYFIKCTFLAFFSARQATSAVLHLRIITMRICLTFGGDIVRYLRYWPASSVQVSFSSDNDSAIQRPWFNLASPSPASSYPAPLPG